MGRQFRWRKMLGCPGFAWTNWEGKCTLQIEFDTVHSSQLLACNSELSCLHSCGFKNRVLRWTVRNGREFKRSSSFAKISKRKIYPWNRHRQKTTRMLPPSSKQPAPMSTTRKRKSCHALMIFQCKKIFVNFKIINYYFQLGNGSIIPEIILWILHFRTDS